MITWINNELVTGIFGGSFDPVHNGHISIARALIDAGHVEQVIFIPAAQAPHKKTRRPADPEHRLAMLELALQPYDDLLVSDFELQRGGLSYTFTTVTHFLSHFGDNLRMIMGMDSLVDLHLWYCSRELVDSCDVITYRRPGIADVTVEQLTPCFGPENAAGLCSRIVDAGLHDISSTQVRELAATGKSMEALLPSPVADYISSHNLYNIND